MAIFQFIRPEPIAGPSYRLEEVPRLIHPHDAAVAELDDRFLWRYLDLAKYLSLLQERALYFVRADTLSQMDTMERSWGLPDIEKHAGGSDEAEWARIRKSLHDMMGKYFVSCWHLNDGESAAMWEVYGGHGNSVAIQTTLRRLCAQFSREDQMADHWRVIPLQVRYMDYMKEAVGYDNTLHLLRGKRSSFRHEREVRFALEHPASREASNVGAALVPISLPAVLTGVFINPNAPAWIRGVVADVSAQYGLERDLVRQSSLEAGPLL